MYMHTCKSVVYKYVHVNKTERVFIKTYVHLKKRA
jgi:hypothetical protein